MDPEKELAQAVAPEDIRPADYVFPLHVISEVDPCPFDNGFSERPTRIARVPYRAGTPVQVVEVCLPLLLVKTPRGKHWLVDVRRYRLARVPEHFGRRVFEQLAADNRTEGKTTEKKAE